LSTTGNQTNTVAADAAPTRRERANLWTICAAQFLTLAGMTAVVPLFPLYLHDIGLSDAAAVRYWTGLLGSAPFLIAVFVTPLWGALADRTGHKPMVVRSLAGIAVVTLGMGLAHTPWTLLGWRILQGVISGVFPAAVALLTALTPAPRVGRALSRLQSARAAGTLCGPLIGGLLADLFGIRPLFFIVGAIAMAMALVSWVTLHEPPRAAPHAGGDAAALPWRGLVRGSNLLFLALLGLQQGAVMCAWPTLALFVTELGVPSASVATLTGLVIFAHSLPVIFLAGRWTVAAERIGGDRALFAALTVSGILAVTIGVAVHRVEALIALRVLAGLSMAGFGPLLFERLGNAVPAQARGRVAGLASTAMMTGSLLGPVTGGWLAVHLGLGATFWVPGVVMIAVGVVLALTRAR